MSISTWTEKSRVASRIAGAQGAAKLRVLSGSVPPDLDARDQAPSGGPLWHSPPQSSKSYVNPFCTPQYRLPKSMLF